MVTGDTFMSPKAKTTMKKPSLLIILAVLFLLLTLLQVAKPQAAGAATPIISIK
jgi:hypothetical protein